MEPETAQKHKPESEFIEVPKSLHSTILSKH